MEHSSRQENLYLFFGEECHLAEPRISGLINSWLGLDGREFGLTIFDTDPTPVELEACVNSLPFFGERIAVRIRDSRWFQANRQRMVDSSEGGEDISDESKEDIEGLDLRLKNIIEKVPRSCLLVIQARKADKRKKIFKLVSAHGQTLEYGMLRSGDELAVRAWMDDCLRPMGKTLDRLASDRLMAIVSTMPNISRSFILKELEKAALYVGDDPVISRQALETVMAAVPELNAFNMTEAIGSCKTQKALQTLHELLAQREPELKIIGLLAYKVRQWLKVRQVMDCGGTEADMGRVLSAKSGGPAALRRITLQSRSFPQERLQKVLLLLADANVAIRSGGDAKMILERAIIELTVK